MLGQGTSLATTTTTVAAEACDAGRCGASESPRPVEPPFILHALVNLSNTCYFNAGVQLLANCTPFVYGLRDSPFRHSFFRHRALRLCRTGSTASQDLFQSFAQLLYDMEFSPLGNDEALSPLRALDCLAAVHPAFEGRGQQDCPEMVNVIIGSISEEGRQEIELETLLRSFEEDATSEVDIEPHLYKTPRMALAKLWDVRQRRNTSPSKNTDEELSSYSFTQETETPHVFPWSWWDFNVLKLMRVVNKENEVLERKEKARKGQAYQNTFRSPKLLCNNVTDSLTGYMLSEVRCHSCGETSRIIEPFSSLTIDIPSQSQRLRYARLHPEVQRLGAGSEPQRRKNEEWVHWWNPFVWIRAATRMLFKLVAGLSPFLEHPVTLRECLDIHFEPVVLKDSNKYHCVSCNRLSEATKQENLLSLPEYLLIQMKRFNHGHCFNTKKTDPVIFPVSWNTGDTGGTEVLSLGDYVLHNIALEQSLRTSAESFCRKDGASRELWGCGDASDATQKDDNAGIAVKEVITSPIDTYTLEAVVNHHGSISGGHYTTFAHKKADQKDVWMLINDDDISSADLCDVADSEEYLLLYKKQSLFPRSEAFLKLREKARQLLTTQPPDRKHLLSDRMIRWNENAVNKCDGADTKVYMSRHWLQRMAFLEEPGPIYNRLCYCSEEQLHCRSVSQDSQTLSEQPCAPRKTDPDHVHGPPVEWFYIPLSRKEYNEFYRMYGGNAPVTQKEYDALWQKQLEVA